MNNTCSFLCYIILYLVPGKNSSDSFSDSYPCAIFPSHRLLGKLVWIQNTNKKGVEKFKSLSRRRLMLFVGNSTERSKTLNYFNETFLLISIVLWLFLKLIVKFCIVRYGLKSSWQFYKANFVILFSWMGMLYYYYRYLHIYIAYLNCL